MYVQSAQHSDLEAALQAHVASCSERVQQLQQHMQLAVDQLKQTSSEASSADTAALQQAAAARLDALEASAHASAAVVSELAAVVAGLPSKEGIRDSVLSGAQATVDSSMREFKKLEDQRWEVGRVSAPAWFTVTGARHVSHDTSHAMTPLDHDFLLRGTACAQACVANGLTSCQAGSISNEALDEAFTASHMVL